MKKNIFYVLVALSIGMFSCKKTDNINPLSDYSNFKQGAYITLNRTINTEFNFNSLAASQVGVNVKKYNNGVEIDSVILYVSATATTDKTKWKLIKASAFTADSIDLTCTGAQLATALGVDIATLEPGSQFFFYNRIVTKEGLSYDVTNIGQSLESGAAYAVCLRWSTFIVCGYNATEIFGSTGTEADFEVIVDGWEDWYSGDVVTIYKGSLLKPDTVNTISLRGVYGDNATFLGDLVARINPANGSTSVKGVTVYRYPSGTTYSARGYGNGAAGDDVQAGYVFSCTGYIGLTLNWYTGPITSVGTNFGPFRIILQQL